MSENYGVMQHSYQEIDALPEAVAGKQDALSTAQMAAINSGATAANISSIAGKADAATVNTALAAKADNTALASAMASLQAQIDNIVSPVQQEAEVQAARVSSDGVAFQSLESRLNTDISAIRTTGEINLYNKLTVKENTFLNSTTGAEDSPNANYDASDFIEVSASQSYCVRTFTYENSASYRIYYYKSDKTFISRTTSRCSDNANGFVFTTPSSCKYIRLNFESEANANTQDYHTCVLTKGNAYILKYIPYYSAYDTTARNALAELSDKITTSGLIASSSIAMFENIGCCGDSFTEGVLYNKTGTQYYDPNYPPHGAYPKIAYPAVMGRIYGVNVTPFAKGGLTSGDFRTDSAGLPALLAAPAQDLYVLALGLNDVTQEVPMGVEADIDTEPQTETYLGNMGAIIRSILTHAPNCRIILCKSLWVMNAGALTPNGYYNYISAATNLLSSHLGIPYLETLYDSFFCSDAYVNGLHGLHPTAPLYAGIAKRLGELIGKCIIDNPTYFYNYYKS